MSFISGSHRMYTSKSQLKGVVSGWKKGKKVSLMKVEQPEKQKTIIELNFQLLIIKIFLSYIVKLETIPI